MRTTETISNPLDPELLQELKRIELRTKRCVDADLLGRYQSAFKGNGILFSDTREYQPGDDVRSIHWKVTARTGKTYVKDYEEDRRLTMLLALDVSASTNTGSGRTKADRIAEFAALILFLARNNNDAIGTCLFDDTIRSFTPAKAQGRNQFHTLLHSIVSVEDRSGKTDIALASQHLYLSQRKRSLIFLLSDFYAPPFDEQLRLLSVKHDVVCVHFLDPFEKDVPDIGLVRYKDAEWGTHKTVTHANSARSYFSSWQENVKRTIEGCGAEYVCCESSPIQALSQIMRNRMAKRR